jgi:serine/threonine-protein kinase
MRLAPGTILRDKYQVVRKVDDGDEGEVFEVRHLDLAGRYALKFLCEGGIRNAILLDELRREALAASALSHPGIVRVFDLDQAPDGSPFMVMEFLNGRDLARVLREGRALALSDVAVIVEAIAAPLGEAHRRGIVHGDLTPANVFLLDAEAEPQARVKILDFGVARIRSQAGGIVRAAGTVGPSPYHAPEQQQGRTWEVDERADVFSLGAIAQALVTGRAPGAPAATGRATAGASAAPVPAPVTAAISRAMNPHREGRFRTAADFARALRAGLPASPARASGVRKTRTGATPAVPVDTLHGQTERVRQPPSMRRLLAAAVGCGVAILVGVVVLTRPTPAPRPVARPAAVVARPAAPPALAAPPAPPPVPSPSVPPPAVASTDRARQPLPAREPRASGGSRRQRSAHAGMSDEARRDMEQAYQKASRAFDLGNYDEAIAGYKRTYELGGDAPMLYNIGQALRLSKRPAEAAGYYRRYLERAPKAPNREEVVAKLAELGGEPPKAVEAPASAPAKSAGASVAAAASPSPFDCQWPERAAPGKWIDVTCAVDAGAAVARAFLIYRAKGASGFSLAEMVKGGKGYRGSIPPSAVTEQGLELYFEGRRATGEVAAQNGSASKPNGIVVASP